MPITINIIFIIIGFILLIKGADLFIDGIASTAINFNIPKIIISLTIVAFGTSAPELVISFQGLISNNGNIVLANVIGSTIVNILLIIGIAAIIKPIKVHNETIKKQLPLQLIIIIIFSILFLINKNISKLDAIILFILFLYFMYYIYRFTKNKNSILYSNDNKSKWNTPKAIIYSTIGLSAIIFGSDIAVSNCIELAHSIGISEKLIAMFIIVIGTSTPELVMAINASRKKEFDIILGNIIGTNIFNIGIVLALPILLLNGIKALSFSIIDIIIMISASIFLYLYSKNDKNISKKEGIFMIAIFIIYYIYIVITGI